MDKSQLKNDSVNIDEDTWYYEEPSHIEIIHWITERDGYRKAHHIKISWRKLIASVKRYQKAQSNKRIQPTAQVGSKSKRISKQRGG